MPSTTSARTFSRVCETIVPSTTGRCRRALPIRRATTNARAGSPRRAGSVADISTPINVPCSASDNRTRARGSAARRIACQANAAQDHREAHQPEPEQDPGRRRGEQRVADRLDADALQRVPRERHGEQRRRRRSPARRTSRAAGRGARGGLRARLERRQPRRRARARRRPGTRPSLQQRRRGGRRAASRSRPRRPRAPRRRRAATRSAAPSASPRAASASRRRRIEREVAQHLGQRGRVAARDEHAVDPVGDDVAVAGDVRRDDRRARRERLRQHHAEALAAERRRAQHVGAARARARLSASRHLPSANDVAVVEHQRRDLVLADAHDVQRDGQVLAQRLERAQQHRQPLALDGLADEGDPQRLARPPRGAARGAPPARRRRWG